ncbi:MAG TPA: MFS transporter [Candidatus Woesebacteria bacterium]|nr:MFS transporter [Candidatus Woesebacteria bacterium]
MTVWGKLAMMLGIVFFLYLGDAILSDWIPTYMQGALGGSLWMGLMMSFSSLIGFMADLVFPQLFRKVSERRMVMLAISAVFMTAGVLIWTTHFPYVSLFLLGVGIWGLYYEFLGFGMTSYVTKIATVTERSGVWSIIGVVKSIAYCIGPLIGSWLFVLQGNVAIIFVYAGMALIAYTVWLALGHKKKREFAATETGDTEGLHILEEIGYWKVLFGRVWPILLVSYLLGLVDATFWTTGVVLSDNLVEKNWIGGLFLSAFMLPEIFVGLIVPRLKISVGKKKLAEKFLFMSGILTVCLGFLTSAATMVFFAFLIGMMIAIAWPLVNAVYSDILARMGKEQKHLTGMSSSMVNLSYITGPVVAGLMSNAIGEQKTMMYIGMFIMVAALLLLLVTPRKLKLPQAEIAEWKC